MQFVPDIGKAWTWLSMRFMALALAAEVAWQTMPPEALAVIPAEWRGKITLGLVLAAMVGRLIKQKGRSE